MASFDEAKVGRLIHTTIESHTEKNKEEVLAKLQSIVDQHKGNNAVIDFLEDSRGTEASPFFLCCVDNERLDCAKIFADAGANVNLSSDSKFFPGVSAIHEATGDLNRLKFLVSVNADVNLKSKSGLSPLEMNLSKGNLECVLFLKSVNAECDPDDGIVRACRSGSKGCIEFCVQQGANVKAVDEQKHLACVAARSDFQKDTSAECLEYLASVGVDMNQRDEKDLSPFHLAGTPKAVAMLAKLGVDINQKNSLSVTPLAYATSYERIRWFNTYLNNPPRETFVLAVVQALVAHGADANTVPDEGPATSPETVRHPLIPLFRAIIKDDPKGAATPGSVYWQMVDAVGSSRGFDANAFCWQRGSSESGKNVIYYSPAISLVVNEINNVASEDTTFLMCDWLAARGADFNLGWKSASVNGGTGPGFRTPLFDAIQMLMPSSFNKVKFSSETQVAFIDKLLSLGAHPTGKGNDPSAIACLSPEHHLHICKLLIARGSNVNKGFPLKKCKPDSEFAAVLVAAGAVTGHPEHIKKAMFAAICDNDLPGLRALCEDESWCTDLKSVLDQSFEPVYDYCDDGEPPRNQQPLHYAAHRGFIDIIEYLRSLRVCAGHTSLKKSADLDPYCNWTSLHYAAYTKRENSGEVIRALLKSAAANQFNACEFILFHDYNPANPKESRYSHTHGNSAVAWAASSNNLAALRALIEALSPITEDVIRHGVVGIVEDAVKRAESNGHTEAAEMLRAFIATKSS